MKRPAMGSQPNLASKSEVVSLYKCPKNFRDPSPNLGSKNTKFWTTFSAISALHTASSPEQNVASTNKSASVNLQWVH